MVTRYDCGTRFQLVESKTDKRFLIFLGDRRVLTLLSFLAKVSDGECISMSQSRIKDEADDLGSEQDERKLSSWTFDDHSIPTTSSRCPHSSRDFLPHWQSPLNLRLSLVLTLAHRAISHFHSVDNLCFLQPVGSYPSLFASSSRRLELHPSESRKRRICHRDFFLFLECYALSLRLPHSLPAHRSHNLSSLNFYIL